MSDPNDLQQARDRAVMQALGSMGTGTPGYAVAQYSQPMDAFAREEGQSGTAMALWVVPDFIISLVLAVAYQFAVMAAFLVVGSQPLSRAGELASNHNFLLLSAPAIGLALTAVALWRVRIMRRLPWRWFNLHFRYISALKATWMGIGGGVLFLVINAMSSILFQQLGSIPDQAEQLTTPFKGAADWQLALFGLFVVIVGPLFEEIFFRGYVMRALLQRFGAGVGIVGSGLLFAAPHALGITTGYLGLLVPLALGGIVLALVYYRTGSLWSCFIAHMMNNLVAFVGLLVTLQQ